MSEGGHLWLAGSSQEVGQQLPGLCPEILLRQKSVQLSNGFGQMASLRQGREVALAEAPVERRQFRCRTKAGDWIALFFRVVECSAEANFFGIESRRGFAALERGS